MPALAGYLHYRMVDVSSLKVLMQLWHGSDAEFKKPEAGAHDAPSIFVNQLRNCTLIEADSCRRALKAANS